MSEPTTSVPSGDPLGFALAVSGDRATLVLRERSVGPWLVIERLELDIPGVAFPIDMSGGSARFQRRRCRALRVRLAVDEDGLQSLLASRGQALAAAGFEDLEAELADDGVVLTGHVRVGERRAELVATITPRAGRAGLGVTVGPVRVIGFVRRVPAHIAADLLGALIGEGEGTPRHRQISATELEVDALDAVLWRLLPPAGWRLPDASALMCDEVGRLRGRLVASFGPAAGGGAAASAHAAEDVQRGSAAESDQRRVVEAATARAVAGDLDGAISAVRAHLGAQAAEPGPVTDLLLGLLAARESTAREAEEVARGLLGRAPEHIGAHLGLASAALAREHAGAALDHLLRAEEAARRVGEAQTAIAALLVAARLASDHDPARAPALWERVLGERPDHAEATQALCEHYAQRGAWSELGQLYRRRLARAQDPREQAHEHLRLGELLFDRLADPARAKDELERAVELEPAEPRAWEALARVLEHEGDPRAPGAWDQVAELAAHRGDAPAEARAQARVAAAYAALGDDAAAELRLGRAATLAPFAPSILVALAEVCTRRGRRDEAILAHERLLALPGLPPALEAQQRLALSELLIAAGRHADARVILAAKTGPTGDPSGELRAQRARIDELSGDLAAAARGLGEAAAAEGAPRERRAVWELRRGRLLADLGESVAALAALERAWRLAPDAGPGQEAARALALAHRRHDQPTSEATWLDRVLGADDDTPDRAELLARRAELALAGDDVALAHSLADEALRRSSDNRAARLVLAEARGRSGDALGQAILLEQAAADTALADERAGLLAAAARAHLVAGGGDAALVDARAAFALAPDHEVTREVLADAAWQARAWDDLIAACDQLLPRLHGERRADLARRLGVALAERGRTGEAITALGAAIDEAKAHGPALAQAYHRLAALFERQGEFASAALALAKAASDGRTGEPPHTRAADHARAADLLRKRVGDSEAAVAAYEAALRLDPEHLPALDALEAIHGEGGDAARVAAILGRKVAATARHPDRQKALLLRLAEVQRGLGRADAERAALERALEIDADYRPALRALALAALARGDLAAARAHLQRLCVEPAAPDSRPERAERAEALRMLAVVADGAGRRAEAIAALTRATQLAPERAELWLALEAALIAADRPAELADALGRRAQTLPLTAAGERTALDKRRAELLLLAKEPRRALEVVRAALGRGGGDAELGELLVACARALDDPGEEARARAALAESFALAGDFAACARELERLVTIVPAGSDDERTHLADLWTELAEVRRGRLGETEAAHAALLAAAKVHPAGARQEALWRSVAAEATSAQRPAAARAALEEIPAPARVAADWVALGRALAQLDLGHDAIAAYESAQARGPLADDAALELFALYRHAEKLGALARALERSASGAGAEVAVPRLREALALYAGALGDPAGAERVRAELLRLGADDEPAPTPSPPPAVTAAALAQALIDHATGLATAGRDFDAAGEALCEQARAAAHAEQHFAPLGDALAALAAAAAPTDPERAAAWWAEAAQVRSVHGGDPAGAADLLARAAALVPDDHAIAQRLGDLLRELGDYARLRDVLELRLRRLQGPARAEVLAELGRVWADAFGEPERAATAYAEALVFDPGRSELYLPLAEHHLRRGETAPAEDYLRRALARPGLGPAERVAVRTRLADLLLRRGAAAAAVDALMPALAEREGDLAAAGSLYDQALREAGHLDALLERLLTRTGDPAIAHGERVAALTEAAALLDGPLARPEDAAPVYLALAELDPGDQRARARAEALRADPAELALLAGAAEEAAGREQSAITHYENAWAQSGAPRALEGLLRVAQARGDHEFVAELYGRKLQLVGDDRVAQAAIWLERARLYRDLLRREPEAYRSLKEAVACDPRNVEASTLLRTLAFARGEWPLAAELLYREIEGQADPVWRAALHVELAMVYEERLHDGPSAVRNYQTALALDPTGPVPPRALARLHAQAGRTADAAAAERLAAASESLAPARATRLARAAALFAQAGDHDAARSALAAASQTEGGGAAAAEAAARLHSTVATAGPELLRTRLLQQLEQATMPEDKLEILRRLLHAALAAGDETEIDRRAQAVLDLDPKDATAFPERRRLLGARGEYGPLATLLRSRADAEPDPGERAGLLFELGRVFAGKLRDQGRAAQSFEEALRADPGHAPALDALADLAYRQHDWERARTLYRRLDENASPLGPDVVWYRRGELAEALGLETEADASFRRAVDRNPSHLAALEGLARLALVRGELTAAVAALEQVLELLPLDDVERLTAARLQLGELCHKTGNAVAARRYFELVLAEDPRSTAALGPMIELYASAGEWRKVADALGRLAALTTQPERRADLLYRTGEVLRVHLGDEVRASDAYLKAIDLDEHHVPTLRRLVDYYFADADHQSLAEIVDSLEGRGALIHPDTPNETLARAAVSQAVSGQARRASELARHLGPTGAGAIAMALAEARRGADQDAPLVTAARALCTPPGPALEAVRAVLAARASKDPAAAALAPIL
jgi:tetratricopeptide (TPR) repeat protein